MKPTAELLEVAMREMLSEMGRGSRTQAWEQCDLAFRESESGWRTQSSPT